VNRETSFCFPADASQMNRWVSPLSGFIWRRASVRSEITL
jgi:hypothetical protein